MQREAAINSLRAHEAELKPLGVEHLYLLGSTARREVLADSGIDLSFDYAKGKSGVFELMDVKERSAIRDFDGAALKKVDSRFRGNDE
jgi:predicted nucleotidyltransferase